MRSWRLRVLGWPVAALIGLFAAASEAGPLEDCAALLPWGAPVMSADAAPHTDLCRLAYVVRHNDLRHVPDWVAWPTPQANAAGCLPRSDVFQPDPDLPPGAGATLADYEEPIYDRGHVAGNAYFNYADAPERQSFLLSNMTPQTAASNRGPYKTLEVTSREWAASVPGGIWTIAGPIFDARTKTIGRNRVNVPAANWKIVVRDGRAVAAIIPNVKRYSGPHRWQDFILPVAEVERQAGMRINLPPTVTRDLPEPPWPVDHGPWTVAHQAACGTLR